MNNLKCNELVKILTSSSILPYKNFQSLGVHQYLPNAIRFCAFLIASGSSSFSEVKLSTTQSKPNDFIRWRYWDSCPEHYTGRKISKIIIEIVNLTFFQAALCSEMSILKSSPSTTSQRIRKFSRSLSSGDLQGLSPEANFWSQVGTTIPENFGSASLGMGALDLDIWRTRTPFWSQSIAIVSMITREINDHLTLFCSLEVFPLIGLNSAASLSCESSSWSLVMLLVSTSGGTSFRFPFELFPLFCFLEFPAIAAMLCEAVVRVGWVPLLAKDLARVPVMDSEPASEPESVERPLPTVVPEREVSLEVGSRQG